MEKTLLNINFRTVNYTVREEVENDTNYVVVPVIMMQDGIHSGSLGALYHSIEELGRPDWDAIPVVVNHPQEGENFVSAYSDSVTDDERVGFIRNSRVDGDQLKAEAWLNVNKIVAQDPDLLPRITSGEIINVSVGVFTETVENFNYTVNGQTTQVDAAINHIPDHLAILPYDEGACSTTDGCGIRVNVKNNNKSNNNNAKGGQRMTKQDLFKELITYKTNDLSVNELNQLIESLKPLNLGYLGVNVCAECLQTNEVGVLQRITALRRYLDSMDNNESTYYLEEVNNDNTIVYRVETRNQRRSTSLYKQSYAVNDAGVVTFEGEPTTVVKKVTYDTVNVNKLKRTKFNSNEKKEENVMAEKVKELATNLIVNANTAYAEEDRAWLETLSEDQLTKMEPKVVEVQTNAVEQLSVEDKSALEFGKQQLAAHRTKLIEKITANTKDVWTPESLNAMDNETLKRVADTVQVEETPAAGVYVGSGVAPELGANTEVEAMYPAGIEIESEK